MVSVAAFGPGDPGSNWGWFAVSNSNSNRVFTNNISFLYSSKYCDSVLGGNLVGGDK